MMNPIQAAALFERFYPHMVKHIRARYRWVEDKTGNVLVSVDDLVQVAAFELLKLAETWDDVARAMQITTDIDQHGGLFWKTLAHRVKNRILTYKDQDVKVKNDYLTKPSTVVVDGVEDDDWEVIRTSLRAPMEPSLLHQEIVDFLSVMPQRDKVVIALRYFERLPYRQVGTLMESSGQSVSNTERDVTERLRTFALSRIKDDPPEVPARSNRPWSPPPVLIHYIEAKHGSDVPGWLGYFTICCRLDVGTVVSILSDERWMSPAADGGRGTSLTSMQRTMIDELLGQGVSKAEAARRVGASRSAVNYYAQREVA